MSSNRFSSLKLSENRVNITNTRNVLTPPYISVIPNVSGTNSTEITLSCSTGTYTNGLSFTYAYQWLRSGTNIVGATTNTYTLVDNDDVGYIIICAVTVTNDINSSTTVNSNSFGPIVVGPDPYYNSTILSLNGESSPNFISDLSTNKFIITPKGNIKNSTYYPFSTTLATYGSGYFNGTTDYLTVPSNSAWTFGTGDFTIEAWVNFTAVGTNYVIAGNRTTSSDGEWWLVMQSSKILFTGGTTVFVICPAVQVINQWYHVAVTRTSSVFRLFLNGILQDYNTSSSNNFTTTADLGIGALTTPQYYFPGYISNLRIVKGVAVYTTASLTAGMTIFSPPSRTPLTTAGATSAASYSNTANVNTTFTSSNTSILTLQNNLPANNAGFLDSSYNNTQLTKFGSPKQGAFTPYRSTGWAGYFDSLSYISAAANSAWTFGTGAFTLEAWIYPTSRGDIYGVQFMSNCTDVSDLAWNLGIRQNGVAALSTWNTIIATGDSVPLNQWSHIAAVYTGSGSASGYKVFVNGGGVTTTYAVVPNLTNVAQMNVGGGPNIGQTFFPGFISTARIVKGVAVYTGNFTPPATLAITQSASTNIAAITGTQTSLLLTTEYNRFLDNTAANSGAGLTLTDGNGGAKKSLVFSPQLFRPTVAYSPSTNGGAMYLNGVTDYLRLPTNAIPALSGAFTVEAWIYPIGSGNIRLIGTANNLTDEWVLQLSQTTANGMYNIWYYGNYGTNQGYRGTTNGKLVLNSWNHFAVSRNASNTWYFFLNGEALTQSTYAQNMSWSDSTSYTNSTNPIGVGGTSTAISTEAYITDLRVLSNVANYTAAFTIPSAPLTAITGTVFLLNNTNAGIVDSSSKSILSGNAFVSNTASKFGNGSIYFNGVDSLVTTSYEYNNLGANAFTVECWINPSNVTGGLKTIVADNLYGATGGWALYQSNANVEFWNNASSLKLQANVLTANIWNHIAIARDFAANTKLLFNGNVCTYLIDTTNYTGTNIIIGARTPQLPVNKFFGYINDLRITKGNVRYTSNTSIPKAIFPIRPV